MASEWRPCVLIPIYNHEAAIGKVLAQLESTGLPVVLVNDGSRVECGRVLQGLAAANGHIDLVELPINRGKGGALKAGLRYALEQGYSHALQIDADGQHDLDDVPSFLEAGQRHPGALVSGRPIYDDDIPASRYYGRYITQFWVVVNTVSREIKDSMCGFRLYALPDTVRLLNEESTGDRMDFDTEVMVRWRWRGGKIVHIPTRVSYPSDGVSHFHMWRDNMLISKMHSRLFFGMLWRLPRLLKRAVIG